MQRTAVIHIGMPKTATKTLQWRLFSQHSEIFYLGRFDGPQFKKEHRRFQACRNQLVQSVMDEIAYTNVANPDFDKCRTLLTEALRPAVEQARVPVWSWESYSTDTLLRRRLRARNLKKVFGDAKILITLRHPVTLLESAYLQQLKRDNVGPGGKIGRPPFYKSIANWLESEWDREVRHHLEYAETIREYSNLFGIERMHVLLFEDLGRDSTAFFSQACAVLDVSAEEGLRLVAGERDNSRWTQFQLDTLKKIHGSPWQSLKFRLAKTRQRRTMLGLGAYGDPIVQGPKACLHIPPEWRTRILAATREGNRWLSSTFNLPLDRLGYLDT